MNHVVKTIYFQHSFLDSPPQVVERMTVHLTPEITPQATTSSFFANSS